MNIGYIAGELLALSAVPANAVVTSSFTADPQGSAGIGQVNYWKAGTSAPLLHGLYSVSSAGDIEIAGRQAFIWQLSDVSPDVTAFSVYGKFTNVTLYMGTSDGAVQTSLLSDPSWGWLRGQVTGPGYDGLSSYINNFAFSGNSRSSAAEVAFISWDGARTAVPEPASWALMGLGFGAMGLAMRRRKRQFAS